MQPDLTLGELKERVDQYAERFRSLKTEIGRSSFGGDYTSSGLLWGTLWAIFLFAIAVWWGTSTFRKENN